MPLENYYLHLEGIQSSEPLCEKKDLRSLCFVTLSQLTVSLPQKGQILVDVCLKCPSVPFLRKKMHLTLTCGEFYRMLITFAKSLDLDQAQQNV